MAHVQDSACATRPLRLPLGQSSTEGAATMSSPALAAPTATNHARVQRAARTSRVERRSLTARCESCERHPDRHCSACAAREQHAVRLVKQRGLSIAEVAAHLGLPVSRVERLLEQHADRQLMSAFVLNEISNAPLRTMVAGRLCADADFTITELARRVGSSPAQVERWLGLRDTAPKTDRNGHTYPPRRLDRISVDV